MSTGRHAKKRAAQAEERLMLEQEQTLKKEKAKKGAMEKDVESQRIATMRARFGGQAPEAIGDSGAGTANNVATDTNAKNKYKTPNTLTKRGVNNPMKATLLGMSLDENSQGA